MVIASNDAKHLNSMFNNVLTMLVDHRILTIAQCGALTPEYSKFVQSQYGSSKFMGKPSDIFLDELFFHGTDFATNFPALSSLMKMVLCLNPGHKVYTDAPTSASASRDEELKDCYMVEETYVHINMIKSFLSSVDCNASQVEIPPELVEDAKIAPKKYYVRITSFEF